ncbi:MAG TPA: hypothetical protein VMT63_12620 [Bacteroidales bacterium]|nr:hypothetical protein [Bacteroidales bacterium]
MKKTHFLLLASFIVIFASAGILRAQSSQTQLEKLISDLKNDPKNYSLREQIIRQVRDMKTQPKLPADYTNLKGIGARKFNQAQSTDDYKTSIEAFNQAALVAPWKAEIYYDIALAQEKAGLQEEAVTNYRLYLLADPTAKDQNEILSRIKSIQSVHLFNQALIEFQRSPSQTTSQNFIRVAVTMEYLPEIPEEARKHYVIGNALLKAAKNPDDLKEVISELNQAIIIAPWWKNVYYNLALLYEQAGNFDDAINELNLYKLFNLTAEEQRSVQDQSYELYAMKEKAKKDHELEEQKAAELARQKADIEAKEKRAAAERERLNSFEGDWVVTECLKAGSIYHDPISSHITISRQGNAYKINGAPWNFDDGEYHREGKYIIAHILVTLENLRQGGLNLPNDCIRQAAGKFSFECKFTLSDDGSSIYATSDNYVIKCQTTTQFFVTIGTYTGADRQQEWLTMTLRRTNEAFNNISTTHPPVTTYQNISSNPVEKHPKRGYMDMFMVPFEINNFNLGNNLTNWFGSSVKTHPVIAFGAGFSRFWGPKSFNWGFGVSIDGVNLGSYTIQGKEYSNNKFGLDPCFLSLKLHLREAIDESRKFTITLSPEIITSVVFGKYQGYLNGYKQANPGAIGIGWGADLCISYAFAGEAGLMVNLGDRFLTPINMYWDENNSSPIIYNGHNLKLDLNGPYITFGFLFRFKY